MAKIDLTKYGITGTTEVVYNPSYEVLFEEETKAGLEGFEVGQETELGAVNVMTGIYTGRSILFATSAAVKSGFSRRSFVPSITRSHTEFGFRCQSRTC